MQADDGELELIRRARGGSADAFRGLVELHYDSCLRFAMSMLQNRADAEDAVQESFIRVWTAFPRYREEGRFQSWLYRILANRCRTELDRRKHDATAPLAEVAGAAAGGSGGHDGRPFFRRALSRALGSLPHDLREAFLLKYVEELTYEEMTEVTEAGVSALKMRVSRAKDALRQELKRMDDA